MGRTRHKLEIILDDSCLVKNKLHLQMTIVSLIDSKQISEAFLKGEQELAD